MKKGVTEGYTFKAKVWRYPSQSAVWYFVTVDEKISKVLKEKYGKYLKGWRMIPIVASVGDISWDTSIFPQKDGPYILPIKAAARKAEGIFEGDTIQVQLAVRRG